MSRREQTAPRSRRRVAGWLAWFAVLNVLWLVFISAWVVEEEILGLFASAIAATAAEAVREQGLVGFRPRARWLWQVRLLPARTVRETVGVLGALALQLAGKRPVRGRFRLVEVTMPDDPDEAAAKRALMTAGESFAPNGYVLAIDPEERLMLVHELVLEDTE
jgi:multisubunit Na+/H+ antiporter MnhE subunit